MMYPVADFPQLNLFSKYFAFNSFKASSRKSCFLSRNCSATKIKKCSATLSSSPVCKLVDQAQHSPVKENAFGDRGQFAAFPPVQSLRNYPKEELFGKVVMVRFDTMILLQGMKEHQSLAASAFSTIKYLHESGAKVILVGSWNENTKSRSHSKACLSPEFVADFLSSMLELEVVRVKHVSGHMHLAVDDKKRSPILLLENLFHLKGERANCLKFANELAIGVDIIVNDAFSESHKALASTVGVASFCYACIAGFYFEEGLYKLKEIIKTTERPHVAIIGGGNLADKAAALQFLASTCDGLVFVGSISFQIMHALGLPVPMKLVEPGTLGEAVRIVESARSRNIPLVLPQDVWCIKDHIPNKREIVSVDSILKGWQPVDIGPRSLEEMTYFLSKCKKITWIGPLRFSSLEQDRSGTFKMAEALGTLNSCNITFVGNMEFKELLGRSKSFSYNNFLESAAVVWKVLKGGKLPGLMALDRAYPFLVDWGVIYDNPKRPLVVDVGSGNYFTAVQILIIVFGLVGINLAEGHFHQFGFQLSTCFSHRCRNDPLPKQQLAQSFQEFMEMDCFLFGMGARRKDMNFLGLEINSKLVDCCLDDILRLGIHNVHFITTNATSTFRSMVSNYPGELVLVSIQCPNPDFNKPQYRWRMLQSSLVEAIADMLVFDGKVFLQSDIEAVAVRMRDEFVEYGKGKLAVVEHLGYETTSN